MAHGLDAALIGFLASGFFVTVLFYPFFWINLAMTVALYNAALHKVQQASFAGATGRRNAERARRGARGLPQRALRAGNSG
jgi:hypothetical protein